MKLYRYLFAMLVVGCTTAPVDNSLIGMWHAVDINGSTPIPNAAITSAQLELRPDSTWAEYYNGTTTPDDGGVWTSDGHHISLTGDYHGEGNIRNGVLQVEWGYQDVYNYRRGP